jgi:uncharacterized BrkB/YihY/UPF0761 family membrane protein
VAAAFEFSRRDRQQAGTLLAGGLAFRFFLWLLPAILSVVGLLGLIQAIWGIDVRTAASNAGLSGPAAGVVADAVRQGGKAWWVTLPLAIWLLLWFGAGAARAMRLASAVAWRTPLGHAPRFLRAAGAFTGIAGGMILASVPAKPLYGGGPATDVLAWILTLLVQTGLAFWGLVVLPRPSDATRRDLLPGIVVFMVGLGVLRIAGGVYFAHELHSRSSLYGSLGIASVFLVWLYLFGRVTVAGLMLNGILARRS